MSKRSCEAAESIEDASFANGACERTANAKTLREDRTASEWKDDRSPAQNPTEMLTIRSCPKNTLML